MSEMVSSLNRSLSKSRRSNGNHKRNKTLPFCISRSWWIAWLRKGISWPSEPRSPCTELLGTPSWLWHPGRRWLHGFCNAKTGLVTESSYDLMAPLSFLRTFLLHLQAILIFVFILFFLRIKLMVIWHNVFSCVFVKDEWLDSMSGGGESIPINTRANNYFCMFEYIFFFIILDHHPR